jgi:cell division protein FtsI (penicillin-binding protein 3)
MVLDPTHLVKAQDKKKLVVVAFFVFSLFCFLILQFFKIQVLEREKWLQKARAQHLFMVSEPFKRGVFYSSGALSSTHDDIAQPLVTDLPVFHLYIDPESISESYKESFAKELTESLSSQEGFEKKILEEIYKKSRSRKILSSMPHEKKEEVEKWWLGFSKKNRLPRNSLYFVQDYQRSYPFGKLLGQVLQTIRDEKNAETNEAIPTGGVEYYFDKILQGKEGKRRLLRSPKFPLDRGDVIQKPENGADVYLTIHPYIQAIAEEELEKGVLAADAKSGWVAIMDAQSGDIWALAQYPFFYPNQYKSFYSDKEKLEHTRVKAITDCFEPGSIIKPLSMAIALKANEELISSGKKGVFDPEEKIDLKKIELPGRKIKMKDVATSQFMNMNMALQKSSNLYTASMIQKVVDALGASWYKQQLEEVFGFGKKTGIELPSEAAGFVPSPSKSYSSGKLQWSTPTPGCLAIGYNLLVNTIQVLRAYAVIASGGYQVQPSLLKKIVRKETNEILFERKEVMEKPRVLDEKICQRVTEAMKIVTKPGGSAYRADVPGFTEAGKTSTSEKIKHGAYSKNLHISTFAGFAPAKDAKLVALIAIDEPAYRNVPGVGPTHFGGKCAAPIFSEIAKRVLQYLGATPDDPYGYPKGDPRHREQKADMYLEVKQLKELFNRWHSIK